MLVVGLPRPCLRRSGPISGYSRAETSKLLEISWVVLGCFDRSFPRPWALGSRLGTTQQARFRLPQKAQAHPQRRAVPCQAMHLPCDCQFFGSGIYLGANSTLVSQPTSTISKMQCTYLVCFLCVCSPCPLVSSFALPVLPSSSPSGPTPCRLSDAGDIVPSVTLLGDAPRHLSTSPILARPHVLLSLQDILANVNNIIPARRAMAVL